MNMSLGGTGVDMYNEECPWLGGEEECVANEIPNGNANDWPPVKEEECLSTSFKEDESNDVMKKEEDPKKKCVKIYKSRAHPKKTLKNLKKQVKEKKKRSLFAKKMHTKKEKVPNFGVKKTRNTYQRKKQVDSTYQPPQVARKMELPGNAIVLHLLLTFGDLLWGQVSFGTQ